MTYGDKDDLFLLVPVGRGGCCPPDTMWGTEGVQRKAKARNEERSASDHRIGAPGARHTTVECFVERAHPVIKLNELR